MEVRENMKQPKHSAVLSNRGFYTILSVCGIIIAVSAWILWSSVHSAPAEEPVETAPIVAPVRSMPDLMNQSVETEPEKPESAAPTSLEETKTTPINTAETVENKSENAVQSVSADAEDTDTENAAATMTVSNDATSDVASAPIADVPADVPAPDSIVSKVVYIRPVSGAVVTPFSGDELLFQPTLGDWRAHNGTDFAAEPGENVLALTDGTVQEVSADGLYGTCVTVQHGDDLVTTYRGLDEAQVTAGQTVAAGAALGTCAKEIDAEAALGTHVHVEAVQSGAPIDVLTLLGEEVIE